MNIAKQTHDITDSIPNLHTRARMLSTEDSSGFMVNIASFYTNKLTLIRNIFGANKDRLATETKIKDVYTKELYAIEGDLGKIISNKSYSNYAGTSIPVPDGMDVDLLVAVKLLADANDLIGDNYIDKFNELDKLISDMVTDKNLRKSSRPFKVPASTLNEDLIGVISTIINPKVYKDTRKLSELTPNLSSLEDVRVKLIDISEKISLSDIKQIEKITNVISSKIDILVYEYTNNADDIHKSTIERLAWDLEYNAKFLTNLVSIYHIVNQVITTLTHIVKKLK